MDRKRMKEIEAELFAQAKVASEQIAATVFYGNPNADPMAFTGLEFSYNVSAIARQVSIDVDENLRADIGVEPARDYADLIEDAIRAHQG